MPGYPCSPCCVTDGDGGDGFTPGEQSCVNCLDGIAPSCWLVSVTGVTSTAIPPQCCPDGTYAACYSSDCSYAQIVECCGFRIEVGSTAGVYWIEVVWHDDIGGNTITWRREYGATKPDCDNLAAEAIPFSAQTSTICDGTLSTLTITSVNPQIECAGNCFSGAGIDCCGGPCLPDTWPNRISVTIAGMAAAACGDCPNLNGTYILTRTSGADCSSPFGGVATYIHVTGCMVYKFVLPAIQCPDGGGRGYEAIYVFLGNPLWDIAVEIMYYSEDRSAIFSSYFLGGSDCERDCTAELVAPLSAVPSVGTIPLCDNTLATISIQAA